MRGDLRLSLTPNFSGRIEMIGMLSARRADSAAVQSWRIEAIDPLPGQTIRIDGLASTMTDALVRIQFIDGTTWVKRLTPGEPQAVVPERPHVWMVATEYLILGVEHILFGVDHLLFVLALLLITKGSWMLVKTITAFTLAHSITLSAATLGLVNVPAAPVEAIIALSIVFVAAEILHARGGKKGLASRAPWIVALTFGLLHGFGFAGALSEVGLPQGHIPMALLFFNIGVEAGQLLFVAVVLGVFALSRQVPVRRVSLFELVPPYAIGSVAMFWVIQRIDTF
jgi:hydrogenase/urease accessory protein HupE